MKNKLLFLFVFAALIIAGCSQSNGEESEQEDVTDDQGTEEVTSDYPNKPIELIVNYPPGGGTDLVARTLANHVHKYLPNEQSVTVVNVPGGSGVVGATEVMNAEPDGYQIGMIPTSAITIQPHYGETAYDYQSFEPIIKVATARQLLLVQKDAPWQNFEEWLDYVKENPGEFNYGTAGVGGIQHIAMEMLNEAAGIETKNVPFDGIGPAKTELIGGHVDGVVAPLNSQDEDEMRGLFSFSSEKGQATPDVPLLKDEGIDVELDVVHGLYAPLGTPEDIRQILHDAFKQTLEDPEFIEEFKKTQLDITYGSSDELRQELETQYENIGDTMKKVGLIE